MSEGDGSSPTPGDGLDAAFVVAEMHDVEHHHLRVVVPASDDWMQHVADEYRRLRMSSRVAPQPLSLDGVEILSVREVEEHLAAAVVPQYEPGNFGVGRSDLAEVILGLILEREYQCRYGYRSVRDRELRQRPGRGIDQVGVEVNSGAAPLTLVLGEAKVSTDSTCPPGVVDTSSDCLAAQHRGHLANRDKTADMVWDVSRWADDPDVQIALRVAAELFRTGDARLRIVAACGMVRPEGTAVPNDFGSFHAAPGKYAPADVRFLLVRLPGDIEKVAAEVVRLAGQGPGEAA